MMSEPPRPATAPHVVMPRFLGRDMVARLLAYAEARRDDARPTRLSYAEAGRVNPQVRVSEDLGGLGTLSAAFEERILAHASDWRVTLGIAPFLIAGLQTELVRHGDGAFFARHVDTMRVARTTQRVISAVYYFHTEPKAFAGGRLRLFAFDGSSVDIEPECDLAVIFPSFVVHEVTRVTVPSGRFMDSRFSINCWLAREQPAQRRERSPTTTQAGPCATAT